MARILRDRVIFLTVKPSVLFSSLTMKRVVVIVVGWISVQTGAFARADPPDASSVLEWFTQEWNDAADLSYLAGHRVVYSTAWPAQYTAEQIAALKSQIANKPDHPTHALLPDEERRLQHGPDVGVMTYIVDGRGSVRHSETYETTVDSGAPPIDLVLTPDRMWSMTPHQLAIMDADSPPPQRDFRSSLKKTPNAVSHIFSASLELAWYRARVKIDGIAADGDGWVITQRSTDPTNEFRILYQVVWDEDAERPFVVERRFVNDGRHGSRFWVGQRETFEDWTFISGIERYAAGTVMHYKGRDMPHRIDRLERVDPISPRDVAAYFSPPAFPDGTDPIRGTVSLQSKMDYVGTEHVALTKTDAGIQRTVLDRVGGPWWHEILTLRTLGWIALVGCVASVTVMWKHRASSRSGEGGRHVFGLDS